MNTNVRGPVLQLAKGMLRERASVVVTPSTSAYEGAAIANVYAATEGAIDAMRRRPRGAGPCRLAEEAAAVALFLLSSNSSDVTGSQYAADGGLTM